jgi:uncharacterized protein (TIRG00374 family)
MKILEVVKKKFLWVILGTAFFYVLLILVSDVDQISKHFLEIQIEYFILIFLLVFVSHIVKSFRQKELLHILGEKIPPIQNFVIYMAGLSLINTPGGVGTFIKSIYLKKNKIPTEKSIAVIFLERYHDLLAGTFIIFVTILVNFSMITISLLVISSVILVGIYLLISNRNFSVFVYNKLSKIKFISQSLPDIGPSESFSVLTNPKNMIKGGLISVLGWGVDSLAVYVIFLALNVDLGYILTSQIYFTSLGYGVLSLLPGGIGVNESIADFLLLQQGLELSIASSLVILTRLCTVWFVTIIGVMFTRIALKKKLQSENNFY